MERARTKKERSDPDRALDLWRALVAGEWSLVEKWESDGRRYLAAYRNAPDVHDPRALTPESFAQEHVPQAAYYREIAEFIGVSPSACLMVGDDAVNDLAAAQVGMKTWWLGDAKQFPDVRADYIGSLDWLTQMLQAGEI